MIDPKDIDSCEVVGSLNGNDVKMIKTRGGYHIFVGKKNQVSNESVLVGASHRAIGLYKLEKQYLNFHPSLKKSETELLPKVTDLGQENGYELFSLEKGEFITVSACKYGVEVMAVMMKKEDDGVFTHSIKTDLAKKFNQDEKEKLATAVNNACLKV